MPSAPKWLFDAAELLISKLPPVAITSTEYITKSVKKICCKGDFKKLNFPVGAYIDFRVSDTEARRYTISYADADSGIAEFIVHLHGGGNGSHFMDRLQAGDTIDMNKPRGERKYYDKSEKKVVLFGDETSLALASSFLPVLKANNHQFRFYFELDDENRRVPELLGMENCTVFPKNDSFRNEEWISKLPLIKSPDWQDAYFVLTGNVKAAQTFRKVIKAHTKGKVYLHGYWLEGKKGL